MQYDYNMDFYKYRVKLLDDIHKLLTVASVSILYLLTNVITRIKYLHTRVKLYSLHLAARIYTDLQGKSRHIGSKSLSLSGLFLKHRQTGRYNELYQCCWTTHDAANLKAKTGQSFFSINFRRSSALIWLILDCCKNSVNGS